MSLEDGWLAAETGSLHFDGCKSKHTQSQAVSNCRTGNVASQLQNFCAGIKWSVTLGHVVLLMPLSALSVKINRCPDVLCAEAWQ
jgi:hypothetical protein